MRTNRSSRHGKARAAVLLALCGLVIAACSGPPATVSVSPVYKISGAPIADMSGPVVGEIRPSADPGEPRFVVVPPDRPVR